MLLPGLLFQSVVRAVIAVVCAALDSGVARDSVREDFQPDKFGDKDFGYPRLVQNAKGELVALYYWATKDLPQQHIAATIWKPENHK